MYSLSGYGEMVADRVRMDAYATALRQTILPGATVLDIGTGPGIMAVLACQLGAGRVYAIEPSAIIDVARDIAAAHHCAEKIDFIQNISTQVDLPQRADVIVSDMRGVLPLFGTHIPSIIDARRRLLAPGGTLIPRKDTIYAAIVEAPESYAKIVDPWDHNFLGHDLSAPRLMATNESRKTNATPEQLLTSPQLWATLEYANIESPDHQSTLQWTVQKAGIGHGILVWFDAELTEGVGFSNAPGAPSAIYGSLLFPWLAPSSLVPGQTVSVDLWAKFIDDDYIWRWDTRIFSAGNGTEASTRFEQSTFFGTPISIEQMRKRDAAHVPQLAEEGQIEQLILAGMDGKTPLQDLAGVLVQRFPKRFEKWETALDRVARSSEKYSR